MDSLRKLRSRLGLGAALPVRYGPIGLELSLDALHMVQMRHIDADSSSVLDSEQARKTQLQAFSSTAYPPFEVSPSHWVAQTGSTSETRPTADSSPEAASESASAPKADRVAALCRDKKTLKSLVSQALDEADFRGRQVVAAMPASLVTVMPISYQLRPGQSDDSAIAALMAERLGEEANELVIDFMPVQTLADSATDIAQGDTEPDAAAQAEKERQARERLALVAVCRQESVLSFADNLNYAGLDVVAIEIGPIAIRRLVVALQAQKPAQNTLVLNCGRKQSYLTVIADDRLLADDQISVGELDFFDEVARRLELPDDLAQRLVSTSELAPGSGDESARMLVEIIKPLLRKMVREIERGLVYAGSESRGTRHNQIYLLGSLARWQGAAALLESMVNVPVSVIPDPCSAFGGDTEMGSPELAVATGLALKATDADE